MLQFQLPSVTAVARSQEGIDLSGEDGDAYGPAITEAEAVIESVKSYIAELRELKAHTHDWSPESGFCMTCGADGNA